MEDALAQIRTQPFLFDDVDVAAKKLLEVLLECDQIEEISTGLEVDEQTRSLDSPASPRPRR